MPSNPEFLERMVRTLFPQQQADPTVAIIPTDDDIHEVPLVISQELMRAVQKIGDMKAPGPDAILNVALEESISLDMKKLRAHTLKFFLHNFQKQKFQGILLKRLE